jgi:hypothetical protein
MPRVRRHVANVPVPDSCIAAIGSYSSTSSACAGNAVHRLTRRACAHHRVERTDRDARHEARSTRSRATSSTKPPPTAAPRAPHGDKVQKGTC